ncbi:MAG: hypothetical protein NC212_02115 [Staphylococcus sp.]|nr:hypothetical protein [Staphylococcus sp.]
MSCLKDSSYRRQDSRESRVRSQESGVRSRLKDGSCRRQDSRESRVRSHESPEG